MANTTHQVFGFFHGVAESPAPRRLDKQFLRYKWRLRRYPVLPEFGEKKNRYSVGQCHEKRRGRAFQMAEQHGGGRGCRLCAPGAEGHAGHITPHHETLARRSVLRAGRHSAWEGSGWSPATYQMGRGLGRSQLSIKHDPEAQGTGHCNGKVGSEPLRKEGR